MKVHIGVLLYVDSEGVSRPVAIYWPDGRRFLIDKVVDVRKAASLSAGGAGLRYMCRICGKDVSVFDDDGHWFVEGRD